MRILHVIQRFWPARGGAEQYVQRICEGLAADGHAVTVATTDVTEIEGFARKPYRAFTVCNETYNGVRILRFPLHHFPFTPLSIRAIRRLMAEWSRRNGSVSSLRWLAARAHSAPGFQTWLAAQNGQFDIVSGTGIGYEWLLWPACDFAQSQRLPFLLHPLLHLGEDRQTGIHGSNGPPTLKEYYTMRHQVALMRAADAVFAQTPREADFLKCIGVLPERIVLAGIGIDPAGSCGGDVARAQALLQTAKPFILALGTQAADKGTLDLLRAMQRLWANNIDADLVLAGVAQPEVSDALARLPALAKRRTHALGTVDDDTKRDLLAACAVLAIPSRVESFGIVTLEAWGNAKPVVGAWAGALPDVIDHSENGLLTPYGDDQALAEMLAMLLGNREMRERLGSRGKVKLLSQYQWKSIYPMIRKTYEQFDLERR